ncbi:MAG: hypothetical protein DSO07_05845 [Thermoproteota archaeon]|jgi:MFS family permease|uniref:MFS transporter n=1 Tax=Candidatus Methanodesulfokora washburnensis TaxID=2478471 RepID=A0A429GEP2_9CREN|nr:MFS transporter [Candidatus Methanodesulfokores washburnensis]RSN72213.1 MFS transporter [Candidatus Methanodesulfokores washburnensis]RZN63582.1 MAG: MFS transporter [Candidatus Methanodesulfokores washburnensis]TDA41209.1 MAG: hypothetical protein DSO07_05845 [Candidatus Korarchaeota archaeon]
MPEIKKRWLYLALAWIMLFLNGYVYAWSVIRVPLERPPYNMPPVESVLPSSISAILTSVLMLPSAVILNRLGPKKTASLGGLLAALSCILSSTIALMPDKALWILILTCGIGNPAGMSLMYITALRLAEQWFTEKIGFATGTVLTGLGISAFVMGPFIYTLYSAYGLANAFLLLGILLLVLPFLGNFLRFPLQTAKPQEARSMHKPQIEYSWKEMIRSREFYLSWAIYAIGAGAGMSINLNATQMAINLVKLTEESMIIAAFAPSVFSIGNCAGRFIMGFLCDRIGPRYTILIMQIMQFLCLALLFPSGTVLWILYAALILYGLTYGGYLSVMPTLTRYYFGSKYYPQNYAIYFIAIGVGNSILPPLATSIIGPKPTYEGYLKSFNILEILILIGIVFCILVKEKKYLKDN